MKNYIHKILLSVNRPLAVKFLARISTDNIQCSMLESKSTKTINMQLVYTDSQRGTVFNHYKWLIEKMNTKTESNGENL